MLGFGGAFWAWVVGVLLVFVDRALGLGLVRCLTLRVVSWARV